MTLIKFAVYSAFLVLVGMLFSTAWLHEATASQILNGAGAISSVAWGPMMWTPKTWPHSASESIRTNPFSLPRVPERPLPM